MMNALEDERSVLLRKGVGKWSDCLTLHIVHVGIGNEGFIIMMSNK